MPLMFNMLLKGAGIPLSDVRLLRHKEKFAPNSRTPYQLWCDERKEFEIYQSIQNRDNHERLNGAFWASFVVAPNDETVFVGIYSVRYVGVLSEDRPMTHRDGVDKAG